MNTPSNVPRHEEPRWLDYLEQVRVALEMQGRFDIFSEGAFDVLVASMNKHFGSLSRVFRAVSRWDEDDKQNLTSNETLVSGVSAGREKIFTPYVNVRETEELLEKVVLSVKEAQNWHAHAQSRVQ